MKNIKLYEEFNKTYLYSDSRFWLHKLEPEESAFLMMWTQLLEHENYYNNKPALFKINLEQYESTNSDDNEGKVDITIFTESVGEDDSSVYFETNFYGYRTKYYPGNWENPPEGGEFIVGDLEIKDGISYYSGGDGEQYEFDNYVFKSPFVTKDSLYELAKSISGYYISCEDNEADIKTPELPGGLMKKIEDIRDQDPDLKKGSFFLGKFI
jgi:hypothetical protein